jgi:hypothetical protein
VVLILTKLIALDFIFWDYNDFFARCDCNLKTILPILGKDTVLIRELEDFEIEQDSNVETQYFASPADR